MTKVFELSIGNGSPNWPTHFQTSFYAQIFDVKVFDVRKTANETKKQLLKYLLLSKRLQNFFEEVLEI